MTKMLRIAAKRDGYRRCGIAHHGTADHPIDTFSPEQIETLKKDPELLVLEVGEGTPAPGADAQAEAAKIIADAHKDASDIVATARDEAEHIVEQAQAQAEELRNAPNGNPSSTTENGPGEGGAKTATTGANAGGKRGAKAKA